VVQHQGPLISSGAIIGIVLATIFVIFIVIDAICCCVRKTGELNHTPTDRHSPRYVTRLDARWGIERRSMASGLLVSVAYSPYKSSIRAARLSWIPASIMLIDRCSSVCLSAKRLAKVRSALVAGIIYYACERSRRKPVDEEDGKLGR